MSEQKCYYRNMIQVKTITKNESVDIADKIIEFYAQKYKHPFTKTTVENTAIFCLAFDDQKIVGAVRAISDLSRHAQIVDLMVDEKYRGQKIGSRLMEAVLLNLKDHNVKNIGLTTEPGIAWLPDFYKKLGFEPLKEGAFMEYRY